MLECVRHHSVRKRKYIMRFEIRCFFLEIGLIYFNFFRKVRLGGWGSEGPEGPTLGRHASACATIIRLRALLYLRASH